MSGQIGDGTISEMTVDQAAERFLSSGLLSDEPEDKQTRETPPAQESPEPAPDEVEASTEQAETEGTPDETETPAETTPEPEPVDLTAKYKTKVNGEEVEVTLDELLKGYSRTSDYTRKTQELATQRKSQEGEFQALRDERAQYATYLVQLEQTLKDATPREPDWNQLQQELTPAEFGARWAQWSAHKQQMDALAQERAQAVAKVQSDQNAMFQTKLQDEKAKLYQAIPEWEKDVEVGKAERARMVAFAEKSLGFTPEEIHAVVDHRALVMLRKAMLWDEAQAKKPAIVQRITKVTTAPPGPGQKTTTPATRQRQLEERLAKTGSVDDAAAAYLARGF